MGRMRCEWWRSEPEDAGRQVTPRAGGEIAKVVRRSLAEAFQGMCDEQATLQTPVTAAPAGIYGPRVHAARQVF